MKESGSIVSGSYGAKKEGKKATSRKKININEQIIFKGFFKNFLLNFLYSLLIYKLQLI